MAHTDVSRTNLYTLELNEKEAICLHDTLDALLELGPYEDGKPPAPFLHVSAVVESLAPALKSAGVGLPEFYDTPSYLSRDSRARFIGATPRIALAEEVRYWHEVAKQARTIRDYDHRGYADLAHAAFTAINALAVALDEGTEDDLLVEL